MEPRGNLVLVIQKFWIIRTRFFSMKIQNKKSSEIFSIIWEYLSMISSYVISGFYLIMFLVWYLDGALNRALELNILFGLLIIFTIYYSKRTIDRKGEIFNVLVVSGFIVYILMLVHEFLYNNSDLRGFAKFVEDIFANVMTLFIITVLSLALLFILFINIEKLIKDKYKKFFAVCCLFLGGIVFYLFISYVEDFNVSKNIQYLFVPSVFFIYINYFLIKSRKINYKKYL